jgi:hypothetical protein
MKKILFLVCLVVANISFAQDRYVPYGTWTRAVDSVGVTLVNADTVYVWVVNPSSFTFTTTARAIDTAAATVTTKPSRIFIPYGGENFWNGNFYNVMYSTVVSGTCDTLEVQYSPFDENGKVVSNDQRYLDFSNGTSSATAKRYTSVTNGAIFGASSNGEGVPLCGYRFRIRQVGTCKVQYGFKSFRN